MRATTAFFLRCLSLLKETTDLDLTASIVFMAILNANTEVIHDYSTAGGQFLALNDVPPNDMRLPVSVYTLVSTLGLPYETVRRHVQTLIEMGMCERIGHRGIIVPLSFVESARMMSAVARIGETVEGFQRELDKLAAADALSLRSHASAT